MASNKSCSVLIVHSSVVTEQESRSLHATTDEIKQYLDGVRQEVAKIKDVTTLLTIRKPFIQDIAGETNIAILIKYFVQSQREQQDTLSQKYIFSGVYFHCSSFKGRM